MKGKAHKLFTVDGKPVYAYCSGMKYTLESHAGSHKLMQATAYSFATSPANMEYRRKKAEKMMGDQHALVWVLQEEEVEYMNL